jgi:hypothetical protein
MEVTIMDGQQDQVLQRHTLTMFIFTLMAHPTNPNIHIWVVFTILSLIERQQY